MDLTDEQLTEKISKRQQEKTEAFVKEVNAVSNKHNLQVAMGECSNCQGKGMVLRVVAKQSNNGK